jgi:hypothetical protein
MEISAKFQSRAWGSPLPVVRFMTLLGALVAASASGNVVGSYVINSDGTVTYSYVVDNTGGSFDIAAWSLEFDFATPDWDPLSATSGGGVVVPNSNWDASQAVAIAGLSAQDFLSLDSSTDVVVGAKQSGFSFTSRFLPGTIRFNEFSADGSGFNSGSTVGPLVVAIPDGGAVGWMGLAAGVALGCWRRWDARRDGVGSGCPAGSGRA